MPRTPHPLAGHARRTAAAIAATMLGGCAAIEDLGYQTNPNPTSILDLFARPSPEEAARWAIDPHNADRRFRGTALLASAPFAGEPAYLALFLDNSVDPDPAVRAAAVRGLAHHGDPSHVPIIAERLTDPDDLVRLEAARALQRIHGDDAVPALIARLDPETEEVKGVRAAAAHALGQYAQPRVLDALIFALRDPSLTVNTHAHEALGFLTGEDLPPDSARWLAFTREAEQPFRNQRRYRYQVFQRGPRLVEYIPLYPDAPVEPSAEPVGLPPVER